MAVDRQPEADQGVTLEIEVRDGAVHVAVAGELDLATADEIEGIAGRAAEAAPSPEALVRVDLGGVEYIDSTGLRALLALRAVLGPRLTLVRPSPRVARLMALTRTEDVFDVVDPVPDDDV